MSFQDINKSESIILEGRACIVLYNFNDKELKSIRNVISIFGISDIIVANSKNADTCIKDLLNDKISKECENGKNDKAVIFNSIPNRKLNLLIDSIKKLKFPNPLMAVTTETSLEWTLNVLIENLKEERKALKEGKKVNH